MIPENDGPSPELSIALRHPTSVWNLYEGIVPPQKKFKDGTKEDYYKLAETIIYPFLVRKPQGGKEYILATSPLNGVELTKIHHFAAPSKLFGVDNKDTQKDWDDLFSNYKNQDRLRAHQTIPGWNYYEIYREKLLSLINKAYQGTARSEDKIVPIVRLQENSQGHISWSFEPLEAKLASVIAPLYPELSTENMLPVLGPLFLAAFSPDVTEKWGKNRGYPAHATRSGTNDMGSTQVIVLTLWESESLLESKLNKTAIQRIKKPWLRTQSQKAKPTRNNKPST